MAPSRGSALSASRLPTIALSQTPSAATSSGLCVRKALLGMRQINADPPQRILPSEYTRDSLHDSLDAILIGRGR